MLGILDLNSFRGRMSKAMNWILLQLAMSYYGDSIKEFQVEND